MKRVLVFNALSDKKITMRHYEVPQIAEHLVAKGDIEMKEVGPRIDLSVRRQKVGSSDLFKTACKKPKLINTEKKRVRNRCVSVLFRFRGIYSRMPSERRRGRCTPSSKTSRPLPPASSR